MDSYGNFLPVLIKSYFSQLVFLFLYTSDCPVAINSATRTKRISLFILSVYPMLEEMCKPLNFTHGPFPYTFVNILYTLERSYVNPLVEWARVYGSNICR